MTSELRVPSLDLPSSNLSSELSTEYPGLFIEVDDAQVTTEGRVEQARSPSVVALPAMESEFAGQYRTTFADLPNLADPGVVAKLGELSAMAVGGRLENYTGIVLGNPAVKDALGQIDQNLPGLNDPDARARVRSLVSDAVLATSLVPSREQDFRDNSKLSFGSVRDRKTVQPLSVDKLQQVLSDIAVNVMAGRDPFDVAGSTVQGIDYRPDLPLPQKMALLGLTNLTADARGALQNDELFQTLLRNPTALTDSLFGATGHDEQRFMSTCVAAATNTEVRGKVPTVAGLLMVGNGVIERVEQQLDTTPIELLGKKDRPFGRTIREMAQKRVDDAKTVFQQIKTKAKALAEADVSTPAVREQWAELSTQWGRTMQKLAAVTTLNPADGHPLPVLTKKVLPGAWKLSVPAALPLAFDRPLRRTTVIRQIPFRDAVSQHLAPNPREESKDELWDEPEVPLTRNLQNEDELTDFWTQVQSGTGIRLTTLRHQWLLKAAEVGGKPMFVLSDPTKSYFDYLSPDDFVKWAKNTKPDTGRSVFDNLAIMVPSKPTLPSIDIDIDIDNTVEQTLMVDGAEQDVGRRHDRTSPTDSAGLRSMFNAGGSHPAPPMSRSGSNLSSVLDSDDSAVGSDSDLGRPEWVAPDSGTNPAEDPFLRDEAAGLSYKLRSVDAAEGQVVYYRDIFKQEAEERLDTVRSSVSPMANAVDAVLTSDTAQADKLKNLIVIEKTRRQMAATADTRSPVWDDLTARLDQELQMSEAMAHVALPEWYRTSDELTDKVLDELDRLDAAHIATEDAQLLLAAATELRDTRKLTVSQEVASLRDQLRPEEFAWLAAKAMITVPPEVANPATTRHEAQHQAVLMLQNKDVVSKLLNAGVRVVILPKITPLTALPEFSHLAGTNTSDGRRWDDQKAAMTGRTVAVHEDHISQLPHEIAHAIHEHGLNETHQIDVGTHFSQRLNQPDAPWPGNYAKTDKYESFAQLSATYVGANTGHVTNNSTLWAKKKWPEMLPLLKDVYGTNPRAIHNHKQPADITPFNAATGQNTPSKSSRHAPAKISLPTPPTSTSTTIAAVATMRSASTNNDDSDKQATTTTPSQPTNAISTAVRASTMSTGTRGGAHR
ncbi:hypothetical protein FKR81_42820 [Lentzea tibetensis]|uniref:Uncharacterized protein n=1 Tax=Lentzea tibetensis TaxID=2591470 RepID=A0A563EEJ6_9PSEU|nr:hypothetical protein [Lentzea tibetensis]TWP43189.1 hypothetical protein FKR81_42820 [Lentzea tibetensis]